MRTGLIIHLCGATGQSVNSLTNAGLMFGIDSLRGEQEPVN